MANIYNHSWKLESLFSKTWYLDSEMFPQYKAMQSIAKFAVAALENVLMLHLNIQQALSLGKFLKRNYEIDTLK